MKILLALTFFTSTLLYASTINLNIGDSITLQADTVTTVTCGDNGNSICALPVKNLKVKLDYCKSNIRNSTLDCLNQVWYEFKRSQNQCANDGFEACLNFCKGSITTLDCLNICEQF